MRKMKLKYLVVTYEKRIIYIKFFSNYKEAVKYTKLADVRNNCIRELFGYKKRLLLKGGNYD